MSCRFCSITADVLTGTRISTACFDSSLSLNLCQGLLMQCATRCGVSDFRMSKCMCYKNADTSGRLSVEQTSACMETGWIFKQIKSRSKRSHLRPTARSLYHPAVNAVYILSVSRLVIHWCTISTPHPQWSSGYDFRVSFRNSIACLTTIH